MKKALGPLALSLVAVALMSVLPAQAIEYGGIGGRPAYPRPDNPRTESIFIHTLEPGVSQAEGVLVVNNSAESKDILVYAVDSVVSSGGAFSCRQLAEEKEDVGAWISLKKDELVLPSGKSELVPFSIKVPKDASVGEHNGCIIIQEKKAESGQAGVNLSFRTGLRVAISIPGEIVRKLDILGFTTSRQDNGNILLQPRVKNSGNVSIDTNVRVVTRNILGIKYAEQGGQYPVLRDQVSDWNFELKRPFWGGWYTSALQVIYKADASTEIGKEGNGPETTLNDHSGIFFVMPRPLAILFEIMILAALASLIFVFKLSRKRQAWIKTSWQERDVMDGEDIKKLADNFSVSWKVLAKANKLEAPYTLKVGQKLKVPPAK